MKTAIYNPYARKNSGKNVLKAIFSFALIFTLIFTVPGGFLGVHAAPLEDCDLDGFDDATGVPVPWPGYDETKGDTPDGPGGGKTSSTTSSKTSSTTSAGANSSTPGNTNSTASGTTNSPTPGNTSSAAPGNTSSPAPGKTDGQDEVSQNGNEPSEGTSDIGSAGGNGAAEEDIESVVTTKGSLEITEASGSLIHVGSSVIISGSGFTGNVDNLEIEIQSEPRRLGTVASSEDGSFETQISIPDDLEAGTHHIVVLYQGREITRQQIEVGPKAANSFLQALSVGFTKNNRGLIPGLSILAGLFLLGSAALLVNVVVRSRRNKSLS